MGCDSCKQFGGSSVPVLKGCSRTRKSRGGAMPLSYLNQGYQGPSAPAGSDRLISEPLLARPSLNHTGGRRSHRRSHTDGKRKCTKKHRHTRKCLKRKGGFYPSAMGGLINNGARLLPAAGVQAYRMVRNYNKSRKSRT